MANLNRYVLFFMIMNLVIACSTATIERNDSITFLDIPSGQTAISQDRTEGFFNRIQLKDIQLQLKKEMTSSLPNARESYQDELKKSVLEFTKKDKRRLNQIFNEIEKSINKINPNIISENIQLIKIKPHLYGDDVFYTRDNAIVIPSNMLEGFNKYTMKEILIHEIFHIYSRNKMDSKRGELYGLIHFKKIKKKLIIPETIKDKILLNPDGLELVD